MKKRTIFSVLCIVMITVAAYGAERIAPPFFVDTETSAFIPFSVLSDTGDGFSSGIFGLSQDISIVDPASSFGIGARVGLINSPTFGTFVLPVQLIGNIGYNLKLGAGFTFLLGDPSYSLAGDPTGLVTSYMMSFSWPMAKVGPAFLGLLFGVDAYSWSYDDSFGSKNSEFTIDMNIGLSLSFAPAEHPINKALYPEYTHSFD